MKYIILCVTLLFSGKQLFTQMNVPDPMQAAANPTPSQGPMQAAANPAPTQDPMQAAMNAPVQDPMQASMNAPITQQAPAAEVKPEQLTWPDTVDITENDPGLTQSDDPKIVELFKNARTFFDKMTAIIDTATKSRADLYQKFFDLDAKLDAFFQNNSEIEGGLQSISPADTEPGTPAAPTNVDIFKQEFDKINEISKGIATTKDALKKTLSTFDGTIATGKSQAFQSQKKGFDILKQKTEQDAQNILNGINQDLTTLTTMQTNSMTTASHDFQTAYDKIQADIQTMQTLVNQLQAKVTAAQAQAQSETPTTPTQAATKQTPESPTPVTQKQPTFPDYLQTRLKKLFSGAIDVVSTTYSKLKDALTNTSATTASAPAIPAPVPAPATPATTPATSAAVPGTQTPPPTAAPAQAAPVPAPAATPVPTTADAASSGTTTPAPATPAPVPAPIASPTPAAATVPLAPAIPAPAPTI